MHSSCGADNGVHRAGLNTFGTADATAFVNACDLAFWFARHRIIRQGLRLNVHLLSQFMHQRLAPRHAFIDLFAVLDHGVFLTR